MSELTIVFSNLEHMERWLEENKSVDLKLVDFKMTTVTYRKSNEISPNVKKEKSEDFRQGSEFDPERTRYCRRCGGSGMKYRPYTNQGGTVGGAFECTKCGGSNGWSSLGIHGS